MKRTRSSRRRRRRLLFLAAMLAEPVASKLRGYPPGGNLVVRCRHAPTRPVTSAEPPRPDAQRRPPLAIAPSMR